MARPRLILCFVALFVAWTLMVGWFAARWGGVYARGHLADPVRETVEDLTKPSTSDLKLVAFEAKELDEDDPGFKSRFQNYWGVAREGRAEAGEELEVRSASLAERGLQVSVSGSNGFSWESVKIDLLHGPENSIYARAEVRRFYDGAAEDSAWEKPAGWILVGRRDWSTLSARRPLRVKFHLVDAADPYGYCVSGLVQVPQ